MKKITRAAWYLFAVFMLFLTTSAEALAFEPKQTALNFQEAASPRMERLYDFHNLLLIIITGIVIFVTALLIWVALRYNKKANPKPASFTHNVPIEIAWTVVPIIILIVIAIPSFQLLYYLDRTEDPYMTMKITGYQWGWSYSYPDQEIETFNADLIPDEELDQYIPNGLGRRLLETYNPTVIPTDKNIILHITSNPTDVIHSWTVPAFGVKKDAVPGRLNENWIRVTKPGVYYGQCSEICGIRHAYMPISVYAVPEEDFLAWANCMKGDGANALYPSRECVQKLDLDRYRQTKRGKDELALNTNVNNTEE